MKVQRLLLSNYRGFTQLDLEFGSQITVLAGVNGSGKSAILRALAVVLAHLLREIASSKETPEKLTPGDIHKTKSGLTISATFTDDGRTLHALLARSLPSDRKVKSIKARRDKARFLLRQTKKDPIRKSELLEEIRYLGTLLDQDDDHFSSQVQESEEKTKPSKRRKAERPLAILYSTNRYLERGFRTSRLRAFEPANAYVSALSGNEVSVSDFANWLKAASRGALGSRQFCKRLLSQLSEVISALLPGFSEPRLHEPRPSAREGIRPSPKLFVRKGNVEFELNQLSDGERGLLALAFDLTRRLAIANPGLRNPVAEAEAIVLLDEIELHLHPNWQRKVLVRLMNTFKNCQFIATTHSPQVLGEAPPKSVWMLELDKGQITRWQPDRVFGMDSNRLLEELMDTDSLNAKVKEELHQIGVMVDKDHFKKADEAIAALESKLGTDHPELIRLRSLIAFVTGDK